MLCMGSSTKPAPSKWELVKFPSSLGDTESQRKDLQINWVRLLGV